MGLAELFKFQVRPDEIKEVKEKKEVGKKTKVLITITVNALMLLTGFLMFYYFSDTLGATVAILFTVAIWAGVFHFLRTKDLIDEVIENVLIVAIVGVMVIVTLLNWNVMETPFKELMVAGGILIVGISLRDLMKFWREYARVKVSAASVVEGEDFRFFRKVS